MSQAFNFDSLISKVPVIKDVVQEAINDIKKANKMNTDFKVISEM